MSNRPIDEYCPECGELMPAMQAAGGYVPEGFEPEYDHYWCDQCSESYDIDEFKSD